MYEGWNELRERWANPQWDSSTRNCSHYRHINREITYEFIIGSIEIKVDAVI